MPSVNPGPARSTTAASVAVITPVNTPTNPTPQGTNGLRLLAVARDVPLSAVGDAAIMPIINSARWNPATVITANGKVNGVQASIATASIGIFTGAASTGTTIKTQAALAGNSAVGSSIAIASAPATLILAFTAQQMYVNVGTALANATVDVFVYGYDES